MTNNQIEQSTPTISAVGIDVAKATLSICCRYTDNNKKIISIGNNEADITKFIKEELEEYKEKIIMESTGRYHYLGALMFEEAELDIRVINPLITKKYSKGSVRKVKTDAKDAEILTEVALKEEKLPAAFSHSRKDVEIRKKIGLLGSLEKQLQQLKAILKDYQETKKQLRMKTSPAEKELLRAIKRIQTIKEKLEREISELTNEEDNRTEQAKTYSAIPGVSSYLATISSYFFSDKYNSSPKQWIAYAGLDISIKESGLWKGKGMLTKRGNPYLRKRLFSAAWGAMIHNPQFKKYYQDLRNEGRSYVEALTIISRKLVRIMFILTKNNSEYNPELLNFPSSN